MPKTISQLPFGAATADWVLAADNQIGTVTAKVFLGEIAALGDQVGTWSALRHGSALPLGIDYAAQARKQQVERRLLVRR